MLVGSGQGTPHARAERASCLHGGVRGWMEKGAGVGVLPQGGAYSDPAPGSAVECGLTACMQRV